MPPRVTALRPGRDGLVAVELDGGSWRSLPADVVAGVVLLEGRELDRATLREIRRALRRHEALALAARALRHRDLSRDAVDERLRSARVAPATRAAALGTLERVAFVDDARLAASRAELLVRRGYGNAAIRADLERRGVRAATAAACIESLEPERTRIAEVLSRRGRGPRAAGFLARRGFDEDAIEAAFEAVVAPEP